MFILKLFDRNKKELNEGDIVKISDGKRFTFWCQIKYLEDQKVIAPFHTFSFHSFVKVDAVPPEAIKSTEERYNIWYVYEEDAEEDVAVKEFEKYLSDWRSCEHHIDTRCYDIERVKTF